MPHLSVAIQNYGDVCACNVNKLSYNLNGSRYSVDQSVIDPIWSSATRKELADALDSGQRHPSCQKCWDNEDAGKTSARQSYLQSFGKLEPHPDQPRILVLKPGNTCNAACRTCNPATSSSWYQDDYKRKILRQPDLKFQDYVKDFESVRNSFHHTNQNFWPTLNRWYDNVEFIDIYGGEPFLIDSLWLSLEQAVQSGASQHIDLRVHTNLSIWNQDYIDILTQFRNVTIGLSIDSHVPAQFEYIRHRMKFDQCMTNAHRFASLKSSKCKVQVACTVSVLNVWDLENICNQLESQLKINVGVDNFVTEPDEYYDIRHLPRQIKNDLVRKFAKNPRLQVVRNFLSQSIPGCRLHWPKFCLETERLDGIRNQSFRTVFPEWYQTLEPYWDYKKPHPEWF